MKMNVEVIMSVHHMWEKKDKKYQFIMSCATVTRPVF